MTDAEQVMFLVGKLEEVNAANKVLSDALTEARSTNATLHRRVQAEEGPAFKALAEAERQVRLMTAERKRGVEVEILRGETFKRVEALIAPVAAKSYGEPEVLEALAVILNARAQVRRIWSKHLSHWGWEP